MKHRSILQQVYSKQQQKKITEKKSNLPFFLKWLLIGALTTSIGLAVIVVLYIRKKANLSVDSTTNNPTTVTTTALSLRWSSTGALVAGQTGILGTASNLLSNPYGLGLDSANSLYIVDRQNNRVQKYPSGASSGTTVAGQASGVLGTTSAYLNQPGYIVIDASNNLYVTDCMNHRVQFWSSSASTGVTLAGTGTNGSALNQFATPRGIARDPNSGTLYIADQYNHRIMSYLSGATSGTIVAGGNGCGSNLNQLCQPVGLQYDSTSNSLFISNYAIHTIVSWTLGATNWILVAGSSRLLDTLPSLLNLPAGLSLDSLGNVYVADTANHRIQLFMSGQRNGITIAGSTGIAGSNLSLLSNPFWVSVDGQMNLYVSDRDNHRVLTFLRY